MNVELHKAQLHILETLRRTETQSFSQLMKPLDMQSDAFKFHLRKVCNLGLVSKTPAGAYQLTLVGKEYANKLNRETKQPRMQPKLSVLVLAKRTNKAGEPEYLSQKRLRQPFYGFWAGCIGGPVLWGETFEEAAKRELLKQTGLNAIFTVRLFYRQRDLSGDTILEDKLFVVLEAENLQGSLSNTWAGGQNAWLTLAEFEAKPNHFTVHREIIQSLEANQQYLSRTTQYTPKEY